jgi:hypothetical protein
VSFSCDLSTSSEDDATGMVVVSLQDLLSCILALWGCRTNEKKYEDRLKRSMIFWE